MSLIKQENNISKKSSLLDKLKIQQRVSERKTYTLDNEKHLFFLLDISGSMLDSLDNDKCKIDILFQSMRTINTMLCQSKVSVFTFNTKIYNIFENKGNLNAFITLDGNICSGGTSMGNALLKIKQSINKYISYGVRLILMSDGNSHDMNENRLLELVKEQYKNRVRIDTIGIGRKGSDNFELLERIAKETGGVFIFAETSEEVIKGFKLLSPKHRKSLKSGTLMLKDYNI